MQLFQNILVVQAADQSESAALRIAVHLAQQSQCKVKVVDVHHDHHSFWKDIFQSESVVAGLTLDEQLDRLNSLVDDADFPDDANVEVLRGRPIDVLVNELKEGNHDLILKDAESQSPDLFFGSLDMRLLRLSPAPVWIVDPTVPPKARQILAAIDPHAKDDGRLMNERVIRCASMLARQEAAELYVASGWHMPMASSEDGGEEMRLYQNAKGNVKRHAWENVEHAIGESLVKIPPDNVLFEEAGGVHAIVSSVADVQPDLLVMGSVAHKGIPGLLIGNTAEEVMRQIRCSVLTLKPTDFSFLLPSQLR